MAYLLGPLRPGRVIRGRLRSFVTTGSVVTEVLRTTFAYLPPYSVHAVLRLLQVCTCTIMILAGVRPCACFILDRENISLLPAFQPGARGRHDCP